MARKEEGKGSFRVDKSWGHTDSNREPSSYEPPALTVELCPLRYWTKEHFSTPREIFFATLCGENGGSER